MKKRHHPLLLFYDLLSLLKNAIILGFFFFVIKKEETSAFFVYGRYVVIFFLFFWLIFDILKWWATTYEIKDDAFYLSQGVFLKQYAIIPFEKIQNVSRHTRLFHRVFQKTSLTFQTAMTGKEAKITFFVLSNKEADHFEQLVLQHRHLEKKIDVESITSNEMLKETAKPQALIVENSIHANDEVQTKQQIIYFKPTIKDLVKASFASLSFLVFFPLLISMYQKIDAILPIQSRFNWFVQQLVEVKIFAVFVLGIFLFLIIAFGIIRTFIKYGGYQISADDKRIYIAKGIVETERFSILKKKVQAVQVIQTPIHRLFGLAKVKLISASEEGSNEPNVLYPFLPVAYAKDLVEKMLPKFPIQRELKRLPKRSFWIRMIRPSWFWLIVTAVLYCVQPNLWLIGTQWWILSILLLLCIYIHRLLDYLHTRLVFEDSMLQIQHGGWTKRLIVTRRDKIIEVKVHQTRFQKLFDLVTIEIVNRSRPVHHEKALDVPAVFHPSFIQWYQACIKEVPTIKD